MEARKRAGRSLVGGNPSRWRRSRTFAWYRRESRIPMPCVATPKAMIPSAARWWVGFKCARTTAAVGPARRRGRVEVRAAGVRSLERRFCGPFENWIRGEAIPKRRERTI